jgi:AcrR family transcriptional regulator
MPPKMKTEKEKQQMRTSIMDAARELFVNKGIEAVSMREIAKRIGYSATAIYLHFKDKESLLRAICEADFLSLASALNNLLTIPDALERMVAFGQGYATFALTYPNHYQLMFMTPHPTNQPKNHGIAQNNAEQNAYLQLKTVVAAAHDEGCFRKDLTDVNLIAQTIWAAMHGVCALQITMSQDDWFDWCDISDRLALMQDVMLRGLVRE